jgi:hypothetical protein
MVLNTTFSNISVISWWSALLASSLAKGYDSDPPSLHPWRILEALTVNQVKSFKALADGKDVFIGTKTGSGIFVYISSITCAPCKTSSDSNIHITIRFWLAGDDDYLRGATTINHQVALHANFKMYSRSAKGGEKGDPNCTPWLAKIIVISLVQIIPTGIVRSGTVYSHAILNSFAAIFLI